MLQNYLRRMADRPIEILTSHRDYGGETTEPLPFPVHYYDQISQTSRKPIQRSRWTSLKMLLSSPFLLLFQILKIVRSGWALLKPGAIKHLLLISDSGPALIGGFTLAVAFHLPYSVLFFDLYRGNRLLPGERLLAFLFEKKMLQRAQDVFVAGEGLQEFLAAKIDREYVLVPNSVDVTSYLSNRAPSPLLGMPLKIGYAGAIYWAQLDSLRRLTDAIRDRPDFELDLFGPYDQSTLHGLGLHGSNIHTCFLSRELLPTELARMDVLFLPLSFHKGYSAVIRTAPTSKLYEYMASQRPILIHAPKDSSVVRYAEKHSFAFTVTTPTVGALLKTLYFLRENQEMVQKNVANAWRQVCLAHDVNRNALILENHLWPTCPFEGNEPR